MKRVVLAAAVVSLLLFASAGTSEAKTVPASSWAEKFCSAIKSYHDAIDREGSAAEAALSGEVKSLKEAKAELERFFKRLVVTTKHAAEALEKAGAPNTPNGAKIATKFVHALKATRTLFASAALQAATLSTSSWPKFAATSRKLTASLRRGGDAISKSFEDESALDRRGDLSRALQATPECSFLGRGGTTTTG